MDKHTLQKILSHTIVAAMASAVTLALFGGTPPASKLDQLEDLIDQRFIEDADLTALEDAAAHAMVGATGDRWSYYIPASEYQAYQERMANAYVGVGITIQAAETEDGFLILSVAAGGPAEAAGIQAGDLLIEANGENLRGKTIDQVSQLVSGKEGTKVSLLVMRQGQPETFQVERRQIQTVVAEQEMLENNIGLVTIYNFDSRCSQETIAAMDTLIANGAEKLIFDVRFNPGGYAHELVAVLDYLLPEGELFRTLSYDGKETVDRSDADCLDLPMAVLVNENSYSAAEFFAAALQEYEAAVVVGQKTTGKGYFQTTYQMSDGSAVALSIGKYFTPKGVSLANVGITPDVPVEVDQATAQDIRMGILPPAQDPQIQAAVAELMGQ